MLYVSCYTFDSLIERLLGKTVQFVSDCELFPNFDVIGQVISYRIKHNELVFKVRVSSNHKKIDIGSNMKNLQFKILDNE